MFPGCTDAQACNYDASAGCDDNSCVFPGCTDAQACNYDAAAGCDNNSCVFPGCTDAQACNYDAAAGCDDNSCVFPGCADALACNYDTAAGCDDNSCTYPGCINPLALNYDPAAGCDDGSCQYSGTPGCTDVLACNYNPAATVNDLSCIYPGCTDTQACNYNATSGCDDNSCVFPGCTNPLACNYDATAGCDDGSCFYPTVQISASVETLTCLVTSSVLTASGNGSAYQWTDENGVVVGIGNTLDVTIPGVYQVTSESSTGCTATDSFEVSDDTTTPDASISNVTGADELNCIITEITLQANGGVSYLWDLGLGTAPIINVNDPNVYNVQVIGSNGCVGSAQYTITEDLTLPSISITNITNTTVLTCVNTSISVTAAGGGSYEWSNGLGVLANAEITEPGAYTVTGVGTNGCDGSASITITQDTISPVASINNLSGTAILTCAQSSIDLTATGAGTFLWSTGETNPSIAVGTVGDYTVTATNPINGCSDSASITINDDGSLPQASITSSVPSNVLDCNNTSITLTAGGIGTYAWSNGLGVSNTVVVNQPGTYALTVTGGNNCTSTASVVITQDITISATIEFDAATPTIDCNNPDLVLTASGTGSYLWGNGLGTGASITVNTPGNYQVSVTGSNGCVASALQIVLDDFALPTIAIASSSATNVLDCNNTSIVLTASGGQDYSWSGGLGSSAAITVSTPGTYTVTGEGVNGCVNTTSVAVTQNSTAPSVAITNLSGTNVLTCTTTAINLQAVGVGSITWSGGLGTSANATATTPGTYTATLTGANGCTATASVTITGNTTPPSASINNPSNNTVLSCSVNQIAVSATGGGTYSWSNGLGNNAAAVLTQAGTYTVTVTGANGCSDTESITITDDGSLPTIAIESTTLELNCSTNAIVLNAAGAEGALLWSVNSPDGSPCPGIGDPTMMCSDFYDPVCGCDGVTTYSNPCYAEREGVFYYIPGECGTQNTNSILVNAPGTYTVTVDVNGCVSTASVTITENLEVPTAEVSAASPICSGNDAVFTVIGTAGDVIAYSLDGGLTQQTLTVDVDGSSDVVVDAASSTQSLALISATRDFCFADLIGTAQVVVVTSPEANATGPLFALCEGSVLSIQVQEVAGAQYLWTGSNGFSSVNSDVIIPNADLADAGEYVLAVSIGSCVDYDTVDVQIAVATASIDSLQICVGQSYTLPSGISVNESGTYTSVLNNSNGCDSTITTVLEIVDAFELTLEAEICEGDSYLMPDGSQATIANDYVFNYISTGGCDSVVTVHLIVHPVYYASTTVSICEGESYTLADGQVENTSDYYEVTFTTVHGCDSIIGVQLNVIPLPQPVQIEFNLCPGESASLQDGQVVSAEGSYSVTLTTWNGCDSVIVNTINLWENYTDTVEVTICYNDPYELPNGQLVAASGNYLMYDEQSIHGCDSSLVYVIDMLPELAQSVQVNLCYNELYAMPDGTSIGSDGSYQFVLISSSGCDSLVSIQLNVGDEIFGDPQQMYLCSGEMGTLPDGTEVNSNGEYVSVLETFTGCDSLIVTNVVAFPFLFTEYSDYGCEGQAYALPDGTSASVDGIYPVTLSSQFGCDSIVQVTVDFTPMVMVSIIPETDSLEVCEGDSLLLIADGAMSYSWDAGSVLLNSNNGAVVEAYPTEDALVVVTGQGLACAARDSIYITVNPAPAMEILAPEAICLGDSVEIFATGADSIFWMANDFIDCGNCTQTIVSPTEATVFTVNGYNGQCFGTSSWSMQVQEVPVSNVYGDTLICAYSPAELFAIGGTTYVWSTGDTTSAIQIEPGETTVYSVIALSGICSDTAFITVQAIPLPQIDAGNDTIISLGSDVQLNATGGVNYEWTPATDLSCTTCANPLATPSESITYCVEGIAASGCSDTSCVRIEVSLDCETFFIPNAFAPEQGGDEMNDCFHAFGEECFVSMRLRVFDRWGELVFEADDFGACWDGTYQGKKLNSGVFVYYFDAVLVNGDPFYRKGNVTLIR